MEDNKDKNQNLQPSGDDKNPKSISNIGIFSHLGTSDQNFVLQYKKTEKILAALYLVTNFLPQQEPLKWELRELGLNLLSNVMALKDSLPSQKDDLFNDIKTSVLEMISLLEIAHFAGFISSMNFDILKKEFVALLDSVAKTKQSLESFVLPNNFFTEESTEQTNVPKISSTFSNTFHLKNIKDKKTTTQNHTNTKGQKPEKHYGKVELKKGSRQEVIIDLIKKKKEIMIKDVSSVIADCSEKTLQRELLSMVAQGVLKKEGERRWSKYSLA